MRKYSRVDSIGLRLIIVCKVQFICSACDGDFISTDTTLILFRWHDNLLLS